MNTWFRKYHCLYEEGNKGYKEGDREENAWRAVKQKLGFEEGNYFS